MGGTNFIPRPFIFPGFNSAITFHQLQLTCNDKSFLMWPLVGDSHLSIQNIFQQYEMMSALSVNNLIYWCKLVAIIMMITLLLRQ